MDKLKDKFKKGLGLSGKGSLIPSSGPKAFAGTARKLGTGDPPNAAPPTSQRPSSSNAPGPSSTARPTQPAQQNPRNESISQLPTAPASNGPTPAPSPPAVSPALAAPTASSSSSLPTHQPPPAPPAVCAAISQLSSDPHCATAAEVLYKLLGNIASNPTAEKYRRVRLTNPKVQSAVVDTEGGVELLIACGFQIVFEGKERTFAEESAAAPADEAGQPSTGSTAEAPALAAGDRDGTGPQNSSLEGNSQQQAEEEEGYAVLPPDADLEPIHAALSLLRPFLPPTASPAPITALAPSQQGSTPVQQRVGRPRQWAEPCERHTRVILPVHPSTDVPQWFFDGTGAELKASFMAAVKRRQDSQVLMTKAMRERQQAQRHGAANGAGVNAAIVKVRLPEAIAVQGVFNAGEPVAAVFAWVASCLADPMQTYELVLPDRTVLSQQFGLENSPVKGPRGAGSGGPGAWRTQSVKEAGMAPSVTVNLRWTGASAEVMKRMPALRAELLRDADSGEACS